MAGVIPYENHKREYELQYAHTANTMHSTVLCFSLLPLLVPSSFCGKYLGNKHKQPLSRSGVFYLRQNNPVSAITNSYSAQNSTHFGKRRIHPRANRWVSLQEPLSISGQSISVQLHLQTQLGSDFVNKIILTAG